MTVNVVCAAQPGQFFRLQHSTAIPWARYGELCVTTKCLWLLEDIAYDRQTNDATTNLAVDPRTSASDRNAPDRSA